MQPILLATDLDRTVLPNGSQEESPQARPRFRALAGHDAIILVYSSGRGEALLKEAIQTYDIPVPLYAIGDVGTTIFTTHDASWRPMREWQERIAPDWRGKTHEEMQQLFEGIDTLMLQEQSKQNVYKLSYYAPADTDRDRLLHAMETRTTAEGINASFIWSIDEQAQTGLLDVLPHSATKLHALQYLQEYLKFPDDRTVFCGDSGNDLSALTSGLNAVLVANARDTVREEALAAVRERGSEDRLYIARGDFLGMNGNYSAGVLEGVAHFFPETLPWME